jgi:hypothetical protein
MPEEIDRQAIVDEEHLKLLSLGYMVSAAVAGFFSLFGLIYVLLGIVMGLALSRAPTVANAGQPPPAFIGGMFIVMGLVFLLLGAGVAFARFWAARCIKRRISRTYCMVIAAIGCLEFPYGTALGVLSFLVLGRESVKRQFTTANSASLSI